MILSENIKSAEHRLTCPFTVTAQYTRLGSFLESTFWTPHHNFCLKLPKDRQCLKKIAHYSQNTLFKKLSNIFAKNSQNMLFKNKKKLPKTPNPMLILVWNITWPNPYIDTYTWLDTNTNTPHWVRAVIGTHTLIHHVCLQGWLVHTP